MMTVRTKLALRILAAKLLLAGAALGWAVASERRIERRYEKLDHDLRHMRAILKTRPSR